MIVTIKDRARKQTFDKNTITVKYRELEKDRLQVTIISSATKQIGNKSIPINFRFTCNTNDKSTFKNFFSDNTHNYLEITQNKNVIIDTIKEDIK